MRPLLVSILLLFTLKGSSQLQSLPLVQQVMDHFGKGEYTKAIPVAEKAVETTKAELGEGSPFHSGMMLFLAMCHWSLFHYPETEKWLLKNNELNLKYGGQQSLEYIAGLNRIAQLHREMGKYSSAESAYLKALDISKALTGENDTAYAKSLSNLASLYQFTGQYDKAEQLNTRARDIIKSLAGENSTLYATSLNNLATLYSDKGQPEKARPLLLRVAELRKMILGEGHSDYAQSLNNLGYLLTALGQYREAEQQYTRAREIYRQTLGENHPDYASATDNLASLYSSMGEYSRALNLFQESKEIRKNTVGEDHPDYSQSLNNLAGFFAAAGQFDPAEQLYLESKERTAKALGENHPYYITTLNNLAGLYHSRGLYAKAEPLYQLATQTRKKLLGTEHPSYAMSLNNQGTLYHEMGLFGKAEPLYRQAGEIWKKAFGAQHPDFAMNLNNLAALYEDQSQFSKAESLYIQSMNIRKAVYGEFHTEYATSLNNLSGLYAQMGQYGKAETLIIQANAIWKKVLNDDNPTIALGMNNLAALYRKGQVKYAEAEQLYLQSIARRKKQLGENHPLTADTENDLALLYMNMKQYKKAEPLFLGSSRKTTRNLLNSFPVLSEKEKAGYISENLFFNDCNNSFLYNNPGASPAIVNNNLDLQLFFKSLSLADTRNMLDAMRNSRDPELKKRVGEWQSVKSLLSAQYSLPAAKRMKNLAEKEAEAESLEKELNRRSEEFRQQQSALRVTYKEVRQGLGEDEAAIEFVSFRYYNKKFTDSIIYAAYILRKRDTAAVFVPLFEGKRLQQLLDSAGKSATAIVSKLYRGTEIKDRSAVFAGERLYRILWEPLEPYLQGIKKIAYAPAGKLYGIAFHALPAGPDILLQDKYELRQYVSTRQLALRDSKNDNSKPASIVLFGDADFSMDSAAIVKEFKVSPAGKEGVIASRGGGSYWPALPFTRTEVDSIRQLFEKNRIRPVVYMKQAANEINVKQLDSHSPDVLHIATHGFYVPETQAPETAEGRAAYSNSYKLASDPLMRNGLILAGGNYVWGGKLPIRGIEDGVLTAYEIAQLNLSNTRLVVLSACETALGDIKGTEGVFGLQRAFKMAGVDMMIVSLWQVPDMETAQLMTTFYRHWLGGAPVRDAFYRAQGEMRKKYSPMNWAAFVLVE